MSDQLQRTIELNCSPEHAYKVFTQLTDLWWPRGHRKDSSATLVLEPHVGGRLFERSANGDEWTLGEIISCEPTKSLEFNWFPGSPNAPTSVSIRFEGNASRSKILITHSAITAPANEIWPQRVALFEKGWDTILPAFKIHCESAASSKA